MIDRMTDGLSIILIACIVGAVSLGTWAFRGIWSDMGPENRLVLLRGLALFGMCILIGIAIPTSAVLFRNGGGGCP